VEDLKQLRQGRLPEARALQLEQHLAGCPACLGRLPTIPLNDPLVVALRGQNKRPRMSNPLTEAVRQQLRAQFYNTPPPPPAPAVRLTSLWADLKTSVLADRRRLMLAGGIGGGVLLLLFILLAVRFMGWGRREGPGPLVSWSEDNPSSRRWANARGPRRTDVEPPINRGFFPETWLIRQDKIGNLTAWSVAVSPATEIYQPEAFEILDNERVLIRYRSSSGTWWLQLAPPGGLEDTSFGRRFDAVARSNQFAARVVPAGVQLWELGGTKEFHTVRPPGSSYQAAFSPDGKILVTLSPNQGAATEALFWDNRDIKSNAPLMSTCHFPDRLVTANLISWSPDSKTLALVSHGNILLVRSPWKEVAKTIARPAGVRSLAWSPGGRFLATTEGDGRVRVIEVERGEVAQEVPGLKASSQLTAPAWSANSKELAFGTDDKAVVVWSLEARKITDTLMGHNRPITAVAFLGDGKTLLSGSTGSVRFWDLETNRLRGTLLSLIGTSPPVTQHSMEWVAFSSEGYYLCSSNAESRFIFKVQEDTGQLRDLTPSQFRQIYQWTNQPNRVKLID